MRSLDLACALLITGLCSAQVEHVYLTTQMTGVHDLGNGQSTTIWGYGYDSLGTIILPAPLLEFDLGDSVVVHMINDSPENHTIHMHGLDVDQRNDGVPSTSFFVVPNDTGDYSFKANEAGTFLYHCHVTTTLHLTLGMYGMLSVNAPNNEVYPGGPTYDRKYHFLASDLEVAVNDNPLQASALHEITPDHFMINGKAGMDLFNDPGNTVMANDGEQILVRVGSVAYSKTVFNFPAETNAVVHMSDGRTLPNSFPATALEVYPGERFSLLLNIDSGYTGAISVDYYSMLNSQLVGTEFIAVDPLDLGIASVLGSGSNELLLYPNPSTTFLDVELNDTRELIRWFDPQGRVVISRSCIKGNCRFDTSTLSPGIYTVQSSGGRSAKVIVQR